MYLIFIFYKRGGGKMGSQILCQRSSMGFPSLHGSGRSKFTGGSSLLSWDYRGVLGTPGSPVIWIHLILSAPELSLEGMTCLCIVSPGDKSSLCTLVLLSRQGG